MNTLWTTMKLWIHILVFFHIYIETGGWTTGFAIIVTVYIHFINDVIHNQNKVNKGLVKKIENHNRIVGGN